MKTFIKVLWLLLLFMVSQIWGVIAGFSMVESVLMKTTYDPNLFMQLIITGSAIASIYLAWLIAKTAQMPLPNLKNWTIKDTGFVILGTILTRCLAHGGLFLLK